MNNTLTNDRMTYLVLADFGKLGRAWVERDDADMSRAVTVKHIASGQIENVIQVLEVNPVERICNDVTDAIARDVMTAWANDAEPLADWQFNFVAEHVSLQAAHSFSEGGVMSKLAHSSAVDMLKIEAASRGITISTTFEYPPIPVRDMDWAAVDSNTYDCDCDEDGYFTSSPIGRGATELEAVEDLLAQIEERAA